MGWVERLLSDFKHWFFRVALEPWIDDDDVRRFAIMLDFWVTVVTGLVADEVFVRGFRVLNDVDLWKWLRRHGAERLTLEHAAFVQALYDLVFAYREGDKRRPDLATGKALQAMIRIVAEYKGAVLWKMQAGMGDTVFTPLYDVLRSRGVRFRFFHQVTRLGVSEDGGSVSSITVQPQVWLTRSRYDPIVTVGRTSLLAERAQVGSARRRCSVAGARRRTSRTSAIRSGLSRLTFASARTSTRSCSGSRWARCRRSAASWRPPTRASSRCSTGQTR